MEINFIKDLEFSDLYLGHPVLGDRFSHVPGAPVSPILAGARLRKDLDSLIEICDGAANADSENSEFKVLHDGLTYRVAVMHSVAGKVYVVRRLGNIIHSLRELGIPAAYIRHLMSRDLTGLFVISGGVKSGKTTTACSMVRQRLESFAGVAVSVESSIELPLEGAHGDGICYQTSLGDCEGDFVKAFRNSMRWGADTILVDEIRDREMAAEVLQASVNGYLVIATLLASSVIQAIGKLHALANEIFIPGGTNALLADGLAGVLHQKVVCGPRQKLETEFLFLPQESLTKAVLRTGRFELLESDMKRQMTSMISGEAAAQRMISEA